jgi:hypothetical protein
MVEAAVEGGVWVTNNQYRHDVHSQTDTDANVESPANFNTQAKLAVAVIAAAFPMAGAVAGTESEKLDNTTSLQRAVDNAARQHHQHMMVIEGLSAAVILPLYLAAGIVAIRDAMRPRDR